MRKAAFGRSRKFRRSSHRIVLLISMVAIGSIGISMLVRSGAAGPFAALQPENGVVTGPASIVSDASASGSKTVKFGAPPGRTWNIWQWNVAGQAMNKGSTTNGMITVATSSIINRSADVAVFSELCRNQYDALIGTLRAAGWPQDPNNFARFAAKRTGGCSNGFDYGQAVFTRMPSGTVQNVLLPEDDRAESHWMICSRLLAVPVRFCGLHITISTAPSTGGLPANAAQLQAALDAVKKHEAAGEAVVTIGDFNAQPHYSRIHNWYSPAAGNKGTGNHRELDDTDSRCVGYGEWTATGPAGGAPMCSGGTTMCTISFKTGCAKIDHAFVREDKIAPGYSGDSLDIATSCAGIAATEAYPAGSCSDHRIVIGSAQLLY